MQKSRKPLRIVGKDFKNRPADHVSLNTDVQAYSRDPNVKSFIDTNKVIDREIPDDTEIAPYKPPIGQPDLMDNISEFSIWKLGDVEKFYRQVREYKIGD